MEFMIIQAVVFRNRAVWAWKNHLKGKTMSIGNKYIFLFLLGFILSLLPPIEAIGKTEFYLIPNDTLRKIDCDYLKIQNNQALCTANNLIITFDLTLIQKIEVVDNGKSFHVQTFSPESIKKINNLNSNKIFNKNTEEQVTGKQTETVFHKFGLAQQVSFDSFSEFTQSVKNIYTYYIGRSTLDTILLASGLVVFLVGSLGYLIVTFRAGIFWGLSCIFLPFVAFIFLFVHWKVAAKPFFISMLGIAIAFLGTIFVPIGGAGKSITKYTPVTTLTREKRRHKNFKCSGKIYCSEMTSCSEAKFYLQNCPGTKIDGNNDGIPCEKQWCGH